MPIAISGSRLSSSRIPLGRSPPHPGASCIVGAIPNKRNKARLHSRHALSPESQKWILFVFWTPLFYPPNHASSDTQYPSRSPRPRSKPRFGVVVCALLLSTPSAFSRYPKWPSRLLFSSTHAQPMIFVFLMPLDSAAEQKSGTWPRAKDHKKVTFSVILIRINNPSGHLFCRNRTGYNLPASNESSLASKHRYPSKSQQNAFSRSGKEKPWQLI